MEKDRTAHFLTESWNDYLAFLKKIIPDRLTTFLFSDRKRTVTITILIACIELSVLIGGYLLLVEE